MDEDNKNIVQELKNCQDIRNTKYVEFDEHFKRIDEKLDALHKADFVTVRNGIEKTITVNAAVQDIWQMSHSLDERTQVLVDIADIMNGWKKLKKFAKPVIKTIFILGLLVGVIIFIVNKDYEAVGRIIKMVI